MEIQWELLGHPATVNAILGLPATYLDSGNVPKAMSLEEALTQLTRNHPGSDQIALRNMAFLGALSWGEFWLRSQKGQKANRKRSR